MNLLRTWAVMRKEARHILRDRRSFFLVTVSPVFLLLVMAYTFMVDIEHVAVAVMDRDGTPPVAPLPGRPGRHGRRAGALRGRRLCRSGALADDQRGQGGHRHPARL